MSVSPRCQLWQCAEPCLRSIRSCNGNLHFLRLLKYRLFQFSFSSFLVFLKGERLGLNRPEHWRNSVMFQFFTEVVFLLRLCLPDWKRRRLAPTYKYVGKCFRLHQPASADWPPPAPTSFPVLVTKLLSWKNKNKNWNNWSLVDFTWAGRDWRLPELTWDWLVNAVFDTLIVLPHWHVTASTD